ncbi:hypothetical protein TWF225_005486 [Orbilia oligospora]|nr:hypothetical protein TWF225_005486 [Orbilia oligospora]KAF3259883.1 hypothetical protein TWF128_003874 [Orbilia oligospora]KAF3270808.1 hypothetical protein TWF217_007083 [Orbilia oligospora]KAF3292293.1 hypothetical protein TWF132_005683 [Orbilia oligospora]
MCPCTPPLVYQTPSQSKKKLRLETFRIPFCDMIQPTTEEESPKTLTKRGRGSSEAALNVPPTYTYIYIYICSPQQAGAKKYLSQGNPPTPKIRYDLVWAGRRAYISDRTVLTRSETNGIVWLIRRLAHSGTWVYR